MKNLTIVPLYLNKVISYLVKCFSYATAQTKEIQKGSSILLLSQLFLMAFGDHSNCETRGVSLRVTQQPTRTKSCHMETICKEKKLELALINIFNGRDSTDAVAEKLAALANSQQNEALNSVIGSKNKRQILWWK